MRQIESLEERCRWQRERMSSITRALTGMPGGGEPQGLDAALARISELEEQQQEEILRYTRIFRAAQRILSSIESDTMRAFVTLLYVDDLPPAEVRRRMRLTEWGFRRARDTVEEAESMALVVWREKYILEAGKSC